MMGVFWITGPGGSSLPSWRERSCLGSGSTRIDVLAPRSRQTLMRALELPVVLSVGILDPYLAQIGFAPAVEHLVLPGVFSACVPDRTSRVDCGRTLTWCCGLEWLTDWRQLLTDVNTMLAQHTMQWSKAREPQGRDDLTDMFLFPRHTRLKSRLCVSLQTRLLSFHAILRKLGYRWTRNAFSMKLAYPFELVRWIQKLVTICVLCFWGGE